MLTAKQEKFVQGIIEGKSQAEAYRSAYPNQKMSDKTIWEKASTLMRKDKVVARLNELREQMMKPTIMSAQERLELLTRIAKGEEPEKIAQIVEGEVVEYEVPASLKSRQSAIDIMNKMTGEYTQKVEASFTYEDNLRKLVDEDEY
jgi:phage terminase small subunit